MYFMSKRSDSMIGKNLEDLTNQRFGRWTVKYRVSQPVTSKAKRQATYWHCVCDCGNERDVSAGSLKSGQSTSCGCLKLEKLSNNLDLINQRFGRWTVIGIGVPKSSKSGRVYKTWKCKCDCGTVRDVTEYSLIRGKSVSCGCYRKEQCRDSATYEDLSHRVFGRWTVIERAPDKFYPGGGRATMWRCKCECGSERIVAGNMLKSGISQSCGCLNVKSIVEEHVQQYLDEHEIIYSSNKSFIDLKGPKGGNLSYDFAIYSDNEIKLLIECQGEQHYKPIKFFGGIEQFANQQLRDSMKRKYAIDNDYPLIEIPYTIRAKDVVYSYLDELFSTYNIVE